MSDNSDIHLSNLQDSSNLQQLVYEMTKEVSKGDPIDLSNLNIDEDQLFQLMSSYIVEKYAQYGKTDEGLIIFLSTITKLVSENFVLNYKWLRKYRGE